MGRISKKGIVLALISILIVTLTGFNPVMAAQGNNATDAAINAAPTSFVDVQAGLNFSMALRNDGTVWCWGDNEAGEMADGTEGDFDWYTADNYRTRPYLAMSQVRSISATYNDCYAITENNELWVWGFNNSGRVGNGSLSDCTLPVRILTDVSMVASGKANHSAAIKSDGSLWTWGMNMDGQIGDNSKGSRLTPYNAMKGTQSAAAGEGHTMVIKPNGDLYVWGRNWKGQLGDGTKKERLKPFKLASNVRMAAAGSNQSYYITKDGMLWGCGVDVTGSFSKPKRLMPNVKDISASSSNYIFIKTDGTLWAVGENDYGEFGNGTVKRALKAVKIMDGVVKAAAGEGHILAIKKDGTIWASGKNERGQLGTGDTKNRTRWVQVSDFPSSGERAAIGSKENTMFLDGSLGSWKGMSPIATDPAGDALPGGADITGLYAVMDEKYLYVAVKASGNEPIVSLGIDTNGDNSEDYSALCYSSEKMAFLFKNNADGIYGRIPVAYKQAVEFKIPLALVHGTKDMQIKAYVNHNKRWDDGDVCKDYDVMDGWYKV